MSTATRETAAVGVMAEPGAGVLIGVLGALATGAAFLPLDPKLPDSRLEFMVGDCGIRTIVADAANRDRADRIALRTSAAVRVVTIGTDPVDAGPIDPVPPADRDELAYIIYTSGSTGTPKGVAVTHGNLAPMLDWSRDHFGLGHDTRVIQNLNYAFDFGVWELLTTLCAGGALYCPGRPESLTPSAFAATIAEWQGDTLHTTPALFAELVAAGRRLPSLRHVHLGGDRVTGALVADAAAVLAPDCLLHNGYGPTETTVNSSIQVVERDGIGRDVVVPIGTASAANLLYVLSHSLTPVSDGDKGELVIGGAGVARGYVGRAALTAERFVPDPYSGRPGARMYRTGDVVRRLPDGAVDYLGRIDHQVKVRGHRVEVGEVEAVLGQCPGVTAVVVPMHRDRGGIRLVGYVVPTGSESREQDLADRVLRFAADRLPAYMVPASVVVLDRFPLTLNGKVDRAALPDPAGARRPPGQRAVPDSVAELLAGIWAEELDVPEVAIDDNFFDLGGDSLCAMRIAEAAQRAGLALDPLELLTAQTIQELVSAFPYVIERSYI